MNPQLTTQFFPLDSCFYAPFATSAGTGAQHLDAVLSERLAPERLTAGQHDDLLRLAQELIAEEALRYCNSRLVDLNLPDVTNNHVERLREAAYKVARHRPLGEIYNLIWRSTRSAAEAAQKNPRAPRVNMSTHAVNQFETHALRAVTEPTWPVKVFGEVAGCELSAMARTLFYTVLDLHPLETSLPDIAQCLPEPASEPPVPSPDTAPQPHVGQEGDNKEPQRLIRWLHAYPDSWDPNMVDTALENLAQTTAGMKFDVDQRVLRRAVTQLQRLQASLSSVCDERQIAFVVLAATELQQHPVTGSESANQPVGSVICKHLSHAVLWSADDPSKD